MLVRSPKPIVRLILDGTAVRVWLDRTTELIQVFVRGLRSVYFFLPPAHRGGRVIDTDALRILLLSREPSDSQERNQDNEDNPNINAHQSSPLMGKSTIETIHEARLKQFCARLREGVEQASQPAGAKNEPLETPRPSGSLSFPTCRRCIEYLVRLTAEVPAQTWKSSPKRWRAIWRLDRQRRRS
jgi:hypothetical protein